MLYRVVRFFVRVALRLFCRSITFNNPSLLKSEGPLLLSCNHPNSFLDAVILGSHFNRPVHFLARGDAFRKPFVRILLVNLKLIPIYRLTEGREYLALNDTAFERCRQILLQGGIVLIFSEGLCVNQWTLRPLKKGTARVALDAWDQPDIARKFRVLPVGLNYNSFNHFGKRIIICFAETIGYGDILKDAPSGESITHFNQILKEKLQEAILQSYARQEIVQFLISNTSVSSVTSVNLIVSLKGKQEFSEQNRLQNLIQPLKAPYLVCADGYQVILNLLGIALLIIPGITGWIMHLPLYLNIRRFVKEKTKETVFFDSVMFGSLLLTYPLYWLIINFTSFLLLHNIYIQFIFLLMPLFAWFYLLWKDCLQRIINNFSLPEKGRKSIKQALNLS